MGTKHDVLTEEELSEYQMNPAVRSVIEQFVREMDPRLPGEKINILDWGCGRGRSVAKLREEGFNAYGVDIDEAVLHNGYQLYESRNLNPHRLLLKTDQTFQFQDGYFHIVFSEQVLEHVTDLHAVLAEISRLTMQGGIGVHCFPGSKLIIEEHLHMPFVHWLPVNLTRKLAIAFLMMFGCGPKESAWPGTIGKGFLFKVNTYYQYLNQRTCYRNVENICKAASETGFSSRCDVQGSDSFWKRRLLPHRLSRNGFPRTSVRLFLTKRAGCP